MHCKLIGILPAAFFKELPVKRQISFCTYTAHGYRIISAAFAFKRIVCRFEHIYVVFGAVTPECTSARQMRLVINFPRINQIPVARIQIMQKIREIRHIFRRIPCIPRNKSAAFVFHGRCPFRSIKYISYYVEIKLISYSVKNFIIVWPIVRFAVCFGHVIGFYILPRKCMQPYKRHSQPVGNIQIVITVIIRYRHTVKLIALRNIRIVKGRNIKIMVFTVYVIQLLGCAAVIRLIFHAFINNPVILGYGTKHHAVKSALLRGICPAVFRNLF